MQCTNCNAEAHDRFCAHCGQPTKLERINGTYMLHEIEHILHIERGFFFTVKQLLLHPSKSIREYLHVNRAKFVQPVTFILVTSLIYTLCNNLWHFEAPYIAESPDTMQPGSRTFNWVTTNYGYSNILMGFFIAIWARLFFRKYAYNIFEIGIVLCYVMGIGMLIFSLVGIVEVYTHKHLILVASLIDLTYTTWALGQFFDKEASLSYVKAFFTYLIGSLSFMFLTIIIGVLVESLF